MPNNSAPIFVEQIFNAPTAIVWKAITDTDQMRQWFFETMIDFEPKVGYQTEFDVECEGKIYLHQWKVTEVVPETRLVCDWRYGGYPGESLVTWELSESTDGTKLKLTHTGHDTFPQNNAIFSREICVAGWTYLVQESLKAFLSAQD